MFRKDIVDKVNFKENGNAWHYYVLQHVVQLAKGSVLKLIAIIAVNKYLRKDIILTFNLIKFIAIFHNSVFTFVLLSLL